MTQEEKTATTRPAHAGRSLRLTDEQFADLLAAKRPVSDEAEQESGELLRLRTALGSYHSQTTHWAERRSAGQPSLAQAARRGERWAALPQWSLALVALVTIAGGVAHLADSGTAAVEPTLHAAYTPAAVLRPATPADIAEDNRLLSSINDELSYHAASPVDSLGLREAQSKPAAPSTVGVTD